MRILVKLGGTLLDDPGVRARLCQEIAAAARNGFELVVVHGGGKQMTRRLTERGIESRFVNGLRVTTPEVVETLLEVLAGRVNRELVASLTAAGARAVGLSGIDGLLAEAEEMDPALGSVGRVVRSNPEVLEVLVARGFVPVVACLAGDRRGRLYNVNADQMAVACASAFGAAQLIFLTDVAGVLDGEKRLRPHLTAAESEALIAQGIATGGMQAKLTAASSALSGGVGSVQIVPGAEPRVLARVLAGEETGTRLTLEAAPGKKNDAAPSAPSRH
jgi:acetylglutamate kinase